MSDLGVAEELQRAAKWLVGEETLPPETLDRFSRWGSEYDPIGSLSAEGVVAASRPICEALTALCAKKFTTTTNVLLGLSIRCFFAALRRPVGLFLADSLDGSAREAVDEIAAVLSACEASFGETSLILYFKGACEYWKGNVERAYVLFDRQRLSLASNRETQLDQLGCFSVRKLDEIARLAKLDAPPRAATFVGCEPHDHIVVVCLDEVYLNAYGSRLRESLRAYENVGVHFHVATDDPTHSIEKLPGCENFSFEPVPNVAERVHYYQSMRFLRMVEFIQVYRKPLLFADADIFFSESPQYLFDKNADIHVGLNHSRAAYVPWRKFRAGGVYVDGGPKSLVFARYLRNLFAHLFAPASADNNWIDQAILAHAVEAARIYCDRINFVDNYSTGWSGGQHQK